MLARILRRRRLLLISGVLLLVPVVLLYLFLSSPSNPRSHRTAVLQTKSAETRADPVPVPQHPKATVGYIPLEANTRVHIFYYAWYGNVVTDGQYIHWKHARLPHWNQAKARRYSLAEHLPPEDVGANFYPKLGPYSSADSTIFHTHFAQIRRVGVGVIVLSWYPPHMADDAGVPREHNTMRILGYADAHGLKVAFHIEPYSGRHVTNVRRHIRYMVDMKYLAHNAYYKINGRPVFYIYDSYHIKPNEWARILGRHGDLSVRGTSLDGFFIGLYHIAGDCHRLADGGFDAGYSYFAVDGFTEGSRASRWPKIVRECKARGLSFIPSIGPGYDDSAVRPWNEESTRERADGRYYREMFEKFLKSGAEYLTITSFNEWHEGTQIEPAVPKTIKFRTYKDYRPNPPDFYLHLTNHIVKIFSERLSPKKTLKL